MEAESLGRRRPHWDDVSNNPPTMTSNFKKKKKMRDKRKKINPENYSISNYSNWFFVNSHRANKTKQKLLKQDGVCPTDEFYAGIPAAALLTKIHSHVFWIIVVLNLTTQNANKKSFLWIFFKGRIGRKKNSNFKDQSQLLKNLSVWSRER